MQVGVDGLRHTADNTHHLAEGITLQVDEVEGLQFIAGASRGLEKHKTLFIRIPWSGPMVRRWLLSLTSSGY